MIEEIKDKIAKLRRVKYGDYVLSDDHNLIVEILKDIGDLLEKVPIPPPPPPPPRVNVVKAGRANIVNEVIINESVEVILNPSP